MMHNENVTEDLVSFLTIKRNLSTNSVRLVRTRYSFFKKWAVENNADFTKSDVEQFLYELKVKGLRNNSINSYIFMFKEMHAYCNDRGMNREDFTEGLSTLNKNPRPITILTPEEIEKIIDTDVPYGRFRKWSSDEVTQAQNQLYGTFTRFLAYTGARFSEAADLTVQYVDVWSGKVIFVETKNKTNRNAWITEPLIGEVKECIRGKNQSDLVFTNILGSPVIAQNYGLHLSRACKISGIAKRVHPHIFRHSFATQLIMAGVDITMVASIIGHRDIQTTYQNYVHLADETLKKSIYRHPLVRKNIDPKEIIRMIREAITSLKIDTDSRFNYTLSEGSNCLQFDLKIK